MRRLAPGLTQIKKTEPKLIRSSDKAITDEIFFLGAKVSYFVFFCPTPSSEEIESINKAILQENAAQSLL